ncbi:MAG: MFS transporter [Candidatus Jordarchaeum sp.]|uniref:MFS transporter n=1 Tax=Candidatus Jordarchaeum sp. TaxID=2823881 RepID=UPI00404979BB
MFKVVWMVASSWARYANAKLLVLYFAGFAGPLSANTVLALVPTLKTTFNADVGTVLLSITALMIPFAVFQLFSGTMSDVYGRRPILVLGFLIYGIGLTIIGFSPNFSIWVFLGARFICGIGYAFIGPVLPAVVGDLTKIEYRGKVMGIYSAVVTFGIAAGPLLAGFFADVWWYIYFMIAGLAFLSMVLIWFIFGTVNEPKEIHIRLFSQVVRDLKSVCSVKSVVVLSAAGFLGFMSFMGVQSFLSDALSLPPFYLQADAIGIILSIGGAVGVFIAPAAGYITDRFGREKVTYLGVAVVFISLIFLLVSHEFLGFTFSMALHGIGRNLFWLPLTALSVELIPGQRGAVSSIFNSVRFFGYALAPYVLTPVYEDYGTSMISSFQIIIIVSILILLVIIPLIRYVGKQKLPEMCLEKPEKMLPED